MEGSLLFLITLVIGQGASGQRRCTLKGGVLVSNKMKRQRLQLSGALRAPCRPSPGFLGPDSLLLLLISQAGPRPQGQAACWSDRAKNSASLQEGPLIPPPSHCPPQTALRRQAAGSAMAPCIWGGGEMKAVCRCGDTSLGDRGENAPRRSVHVHPSATGVPRLEEECVGAGRGAAWSGCYQSIPAPRSQRSPGSGCEVSC